MRRPAATRRRLWLPGAALLVASWATPALGQPATADELARRHFESGEAYLHESDYDNALKAFEKSYDLSSRPVILLSIATVYERLGELGKAIAALEKYLETAADGAHAETVKLRIANLKKRESEHRPEPPEPPPAEPPPTPSTVAPTEAPETEADPPPGPPPSGNRVPAYVLFGVGGLTGIGAGITGLLAKKEHDDAEKTCAPNCSNSDVSTGKAMAWTSTALTGVAIVSVGVGAALFFTMGSSSAASEQSKARPRLQVGFGPRSVGAQAKWRF